MSNRTSGGEVPTDAAELRRLISDTRRGQHRDPGRRDAVFRVLVLSDPDLVALAVALNRGLREGQSIASITHAVSARGAKRCIDEAAVLAFIRLAKLEARVAKRGGYGSYHARMQALSVELGRSAYTHRRGPARTCADDLLEEDEDTVDASDYIRGQGGF